jgi:N-acetylmuramoyl-L-alanine amidase
MKRILAAIVAFWVMTGWLMTGWAMTGVAQAQEFSGLARIDAARSAITDLKGDGVQIELFLSQGVPYRLFTLDAPLRLVLDFQEVDWSGLNAAELVKSARISQVRFGTYVPGWSRLVVDLGRPMAVQTAGVRIDPVTSAARLSVTLRPQDPEDFAAGAGAPYDPRWDLPAPAEVQEPEDRGEDAPLRVVLDPGHGGIDPGAERQGLREKDLMLTFALELRDTLLRSGGFAVSLTRESDYFVSLERRIALAHRAGADVFISLHADSLSEGQAHGATVHVLAREASDIASAKLAERQDRSDLLAGVDLSTTDDRVTGILLDLARQETQPRSDELAGALVEGMVQTGGPMNTRPRRSAGFSVLKAADIPSVLVEIGFMSSPRDLKNLQDAAWRAKMARGIRNGLQVWRDADKAQRPLVRR